LDAFVSELLAHLQSSAFQDIAGAHVSATVPVSRSLVNGLAARALQGTTTPIRQLDIRPRAGDLIDVMVTVSWPFVPPLKVVVAVERQPQFPGSPILVLRWSLFGGLGAIAARLLGAMDKLPPGVRLDGEHLSLDIPTLAAQSPAAAMLRYVKTLEVHTAEGRLIIVTSAEIPG
jgi:hypothetical protein